MFIMQKCDKRRTNRLQCDSVKQQMNQKCFAVSKLAAVGHNEQLHLFWQSILHTCLRLSRR